MTAPRAATLSHVMAERARHTQKQTHETGEPTGGQESGGTGIGERKWKSRCEEMLI